MEARTSSSSNMEDARHFIRDHNVDDGLKIYGAYQSIRPFRFRCPPAKRKPSYIIQQLLPCLTWLRNYHLSFLEYDLIAGITVGLTVVPQSIAYAAIANLPLQYGLYTSFMGAFIYALLGTSKDVSLGPTTVMALLVAQKASQYPAESAAAVAVLLTFYTGCVQLAMGIFQLGFFVDFVSLAVSKAFMAAAAVIIAGEQLKNLLGLKNIVSEHFLVVIYDTFARIAETNYQDLLLGLCCIVCITVLKCIAPRGQFVRVRWYDKVAYQVLRLASNARYAIVVIAAGAIEGALLSQGIDVLSLPHDVMPGLPVVQPPQFRIENCTANQTCTTYQTFRSLGSSLVVFPLIGLLELATIAKSFAQENRYIVNSSQEFRAVGIANVVSSFFSSYPVTASFSRSALNAQCQVKSQAAGIVTGGLAILATAFLTGWLHYVPKACLAAVIICAVLPNIDLSVANHMWKVRKGDLFPYVTTLLACFVLGIEYGVLVGIFVSVGLVLFPLARPTVAVYHSSFPGNASGQEIIVTPYGNIHFPAIGYVRKVIIEHIEKAESGPGRVVIDGSHWTDLDFSVAARMSSLIREVQNLGWEISFSEMSEMVMGTFDTAPVVRRPKRAGSQDSVISSITAVGS